MGLLVAIGPEPLWSHRFIVGEMFGALLEVKVVVERWRREYNHIRPHSRLTFEIVQSMGARQAVEAFKRVREGKDICKLVIEAGH
jgi:transposase InsO family protein